MIEIIKGHFQKHPLAGTVLMAGAAMVGIFAGDANMPLQLKALASRAYHQAAGSHYSIMIAGAQATAKLGPVRETKLGINLSDLHWWNHNRAYGNLAMTAWWKLKMPGQPYENLGRTSQTADGGVASLPVGGQAITSITQPITDSAGKIIECTFDGGGKVNVGGASDISFAPGYLSFKFVNTGKPRSALNVYIEQRDLVRPLTHLDCREKGYDRDIRFDPDFIAFVKQFRLLRFMDIENTNANRAVNWATRKRPDSIGVVDEDGMSIEDMVELANLARTDAWFSMPWNATDDYVERFATYVHDHLRPGQVAYVELSNEVWNDAFPVAVQARTEGLALRLDPSDNRAKLLRYAQKTSEVMRIWTKAFKDNPTRLVRVAASQSVNPWAAEQILSFADTASFVDALATAPYFGNGRCRELAEPGPILKCLSAAIDETIEGARQNRAVAQKYGKRYFAYEAGQHVRFPNNVKLLEELSRDPEMETLYRRYIARWKADVGDYLVLYSSINPISQYGAWGLMEYPGQPLADAPKMRAVLASGLARH